MEIYVPFMKFPEKEIYRIKMDQQLKFGFLKFRHFSNDGLSENRLHLNLLADDIIFPEFPYQKIAILGV